MIAGFLQLVWKIVWSGIIILICTSLIFIGYKANLPMAVSGAPAGMTYVEFIRDRLDAAQTVKPSQCGWGMMLSLAALGPIYSVVYTSVAIHPGGFLDKITAPDPNIPTEVAGAKWYEVPGIWWDVVERLSWTMLGKQTSFGCQFRPVALIIGQKTTYCAHYFHCLIYDLHRNCTKLSVKEKRPTDFQNLCGDSK